MSTEPRERPERSDAVPTDRPDPAHEIDQVPVVDGPDGAAAGEPTVLHSDDVALHPEGGPGAGAVPTDRDEPADGEHIEHTS